MEAPRDDYTHAERWSVSKQQRNSRRAFRSKRLKGLFLQAVALGWVPEIRGSGHMRLLPPDGSPPLVLSLTARDGYDRGFQNAEAVLKRWQKENPQ